MYLWKTCGFVYVDDLTYAVFNVLNKYCNSKPINFSSGHGISIEDLVKIVSKLPSLGPKSARRIVLKLINNREELIKPLTNTLAQVYKNLRRCKICGDYFSTHSKCACSNKNYDQICVVQQIQDKWTIEESGIYKGHYHILGGTLPTFESKKNDSLLITSLINRVKNNNTVKEIILACGNTVEGQVTSHYIQDCL